MVKAKEKARVTEIMSTDPFLLDFVQLLSQRQKMLLANLPESPAAAQLKAITPSLSLAQAALEKQVLIAENRDLPCQIAVVGPTQAGKSSLVNLILGQAVAGVSPLAGFTIQPQAFVYGSAELPDIGWLEKFFAGYACLKIQDLPRDRFDCLGIARVEATRESPLPPCVIWDTPDFDSLRSQQYLNSVLRTVALADLLVVVVSKDKYADQAVWDFLTLIEPLAQPTLVCINKIRPTARNTLFQSWKEKWHQLRKDPCPRLMALEYYEHPEDLQAASSLALEALIPLLGTAMQERKQQAQRAKALVRAHWPKWSAPIRAELEAKRRFKAMIDTAISQALAVYRTDFLDHPIAYATFQRALAELLILLEIPGLARPMMLIRRAITWPIKALLGKRRNVDADAVQELFILRRSVEHALLQLLTSIRDQTAGLDPAVHWWQEIDRCYQAARPALIRFFETESLTYYQAFNPQVEAAAMRLYRRLQEMPATLNSLRAARISADAAGLALLFQTGGIGPHDVVLAPAMLSLTSLLAESALGKYMEIVAADLKRTQLEAVKTLLQGLGEKILGLVEQMDTNVCFNIPEPVLTQVEDTLNERPYGLKLFSPAFLRD